MDIFEKCHEINDYLNSRDETSARNELIKLLDYHKSNQIQYSSLINNLIRQVGLFPYIQLETSDWQDRYAHEAFKVDVGERDRLALHREQSAILKKLIEGKNLAVSAPTSFGKSFVIDAFIALKRPKNVVIIVPTIALTDETRRRLHKKFGANYKIITTSEAKLSDANIFIFPQERAIHYAEQLDEIDILIVDEFYKASSAFDKDRSPSLINAILKLGSKAKQKYFLAPNISSLNDSIFTKNIEFISVNFNTVFLEKHELYYEIGGDERIKSDTLVDILNQTNGKTLIYAGTFKNIDSVSNLLIDRFPVSNSGLLRDFHHWLSRNYDVNWKLTNLVKRGSGIHNGRLHRSLSQIQVRLFEEEDGLKNLISTSSIIEGVNTSAENVVLWSNQSGRGRARINDFSYKNIIGRGGRMFRHFIGKIYILEKPPEETETQLELEFPDQLVGSIDLEEYKTELTQEQIARIIAYRQDMEELLGEGKLYQIQKDGQLESSDSFLIHDIAKELVTNKLTWSGLGYLNSNFPEDWEAYLYKVIKLSPSGWGGPYNKFVGFVKVLSQNWSLTIPQLLNKLEDLDIGIEQFFELEKIVTFKLTSLLNDVNVLQKNILNENIDISPFIGKVSNAFLPPLVYQLEEYGLPRMLSRKVHELGVIDLIRDDIEIHDVLDDFTNMSIEHKTRLNASFNNFDRYIFDYFLEGITRE
ncbi:DEAD/DEAH box helicase [Vibrio cholerae]|uniref:DEAD/DEAH box helicase n=1 Tax=Vibrio vulnificus TaxID=672 RepID=UPI0028D9E47B|nr:DEAD/DEAH box helicase [Vibrio cholerae]ELY5188717.1 DEAD/DEAH box helicase [Vibrio cholerae]ELY5288777.1 DEAD/DEAH box helicase [Vibrio cholerae]